MFNRSNSCNTYTNSSGLTNTSSTLSYQSSNNLVNNINIIQQQN